MARKKQTKGSCTYCGREMTKGGLSKHLRSCKERNTVITEADAGAGKDEIIYQLQIQDIWNTDFWLHLEMTGSSTLKDLDYYLRAIWLECCGHMSEFSFGRWEEEIPMNTKVEKLFREGLELNHVYDFGTSSETKIKVISARKGKPLTSNPIVLMARNNPPEAKCSECGKPATFLCVECLYEYDQYGALCDDHAETHPHDNYGEPLPLVNSPRLGMCGYDGPAEPPY
jgi:hypothetical protein